MARMFPDRIDAAERALGDLLYVGMTRAKHRLVIPYVTETDVSRRMRQCLAEIARLD